LKDRSNNKLKLKD